MKLPSALALACVYVVWGSTYYAMRLALDGFPPLLMAGIRFVVAGSILLAITRFGSKGGGSSLGVRGWKIAAITGVLLLTVGNGGVALAERSVPSGLCALVIGTMPLWAALLARLLGEKIAPLEALGLAIGFSGVIVLNVGHGLGGTAIDMVSIFVAPISWAIGTTITRRSKLEAGFSLSAAQMLSGGIVLLVLGVLHGESIEHVPPLRSIGAVFYLAIFGSVVAFTAYGYALRTLSAPVATSYAYVNPIVALGLGALLLGEPVGARAVVAASAISGGVLVLLVGRRIATRTSTPSLTPKGRSGAPP